MRTGKTLLTRSSPPTPRSAASALMGSTSRKGTKGRRRGKVRTRPESGCYCGAVQASEPGFEEVLQPRRHGPNLALGGDP